MMLSHPPRCLKGMPSSNKKHVGNLKYEGGGNGGGVYKKTIKFCLAEFGNEHIQGIFVHSFATLILSYTALMINEILCGTKCIVWEPSFKRPLVFYLA